MSPACFNLSALSLSPLSPLSSVLFPHALLNKVHSPHRTQPPHGPTGSFTHPVVQPVFVKVHVHVWCKDGKISLFSLSPPNFLFLLLTLPGMREHPPIPVIDLADHIERLKANDGLRFSQEYEVRALNWSCVNHINVFLCYNIWVEVLCSCLFDPICMYSNGLGKTSFTDIPQSFLQLHYHSHQETNTYIKYCEILSHKNEQVASCLGNLCASWCFP